MDAACSLVAEFMIPELGEAISEALGNVFEFIQEMKESEEICRRVYERMKFVNEELYKITDETVLRQNRVLFMYGRTISDFLTFLKRQSQKSLIKRLASNRKVVDAIQDFHNDMDELFKLLNIAHMAEMAKWKQEWEEDRKRIHHQMAEILANGQSIHAEIQNSGATLKEGLAMIKYELEHKKEQNDPEQLKLMHKAFKKVVSTSKAKVPVVPEWFISSDDVEFDAKDQFDCGSYGSVHRGSTLDNAFCRYLRQVTEQQVSCAASCSCTLPDDTQGCDALTSERTAYVEEQVRCTVLSPGDNQGNEPDAPSSLQTPECSVPVILPAEPGQDTAWTVASNAVKAQPEQDTASCCQ
ncbi:hypothetical protein PI126_g16277 [Phytophthora idaei]|nr:hypothetical protein PI126_g16277 [Phytophthora idaei]